MDILKKFDADKEKSDTLEDAFKSCRYPDNLSISLLAADIGATEEDVQVWVAYCKISSFCLTLFILNTTYFENGQFRFP